MLYRDAGNTAIMQILEKYRKRPRFSFILLHRGAACSGIIDSFPCVHRGRMGSSTSAARDQWLIGKSGQSITALEIEEPIMTARKISAQFMRLNVL